MSGKIDLLIGQFVANEGGNPAVINNRNRFTVNTGVNTVNIDTATAPVWNFTFLKPYGTLPRFFSARDNIRVLSMGVMLPYGFEIGDTPITMSINKLCTYNKIGAPASQPFNEFLDYDGGDSTFSFPFANYEFATDIISEFFAQDPNPAISITSYAITCKILSGNINMVGVNSSLNGQVITPIPFMKVLHTIPVSVNRLI